MREIVLDTANFTGDVIIETSGFEGDYDNLFKNIRKAGKERGLFGVLGQITGLRTNKGVEKSSQKKQDRAQRKTDRNARKNLLAEAKANLKGSKAEKNLADADSTRAQGELVSSVAQTKSQAPETAPIPEKKGPDMMMVGVGFGFLLMIVLVLFFIMRKTPKLQGV